MTDTTKTNDGLRAITRDMVRQQLSDVAVDLFAEHGFERVTVEQVAAAAGVSVRSVHRYFPAKEDMVVGPLAAYGEDVRDALEDRPAGEPVMASLHTAFATMLRQRPQTQRDKVAIRLLSSTPSLHARNAGKHLAWARLLEPLIAERLRGEDAELRARVLVQASLGAFSTALAAWADEGEERGLHELLQVAFLTLERA
ncbi:TetR family transcriptional regulator [Rhodococcus erythropolis]|uniref:TetR/AcrR family transcriptional regulator n=1 Tax=Rhodococcus erythropolis TaxID=1833 RepID=UPI00294930CB|nr:TetR family transcriptional regulator [Rhodococcus erythropolis]MDV6212713.1 TetR family transcriptional regulator [Rhodococcus erythropolis]